MFLNTKLLFLILEDRQQFWQLEQFNNLIAKPSNRIVKYSKYYIFMCIAFYAILLLSNKRYDGIITNKKVSFALNILLLICFYIVLTN